MIKRLLNTDTFKFETTAGSVFVNIERLNNGVNGNPRYKASVMTMFDDFNPGYLFTRVYRFDGHYLDLKSEARFILQHSIDTDLLSLNISIMEN